MSTCLHCYNWHRTSEQKGQCRVAHPRCELVPVQHISGTGMGVITFWPETSPGDCCGEWENAEVDDPDKLSL